MRPRAFTSSPFLLMSLFFLGLSLGASAESGEPVEDLELLDQAQKIKKSLSKTEKKQHSILGDLFLIQDQIQRNVDERAELLQSLKTLRATANRSALEVKATKEQLKKQRQQLLNKFKLMYRMGQQGPISALFGSLSAHDLDQSVKYLSKFSKSDLDLIKKYSDILRKSQLAKVKLREKLKALVSLKRKSKSQEQRLLAKQGSKANLLKRIRELKTQNLKKYLSLKSQLQSASKASGTELSLKTSIFERKGTLSEPLIGGEKRGFGTKRDSRFGFELSHQGIRYVSEKKAEVRSVFSGRVVYAETLPSVGQSLMINHGDNYYSIYLHLSETGLKAGDEVKEGQIVGRAGWLPLERRPGAYYELRHFSEAIDPGPWFQFKKIANYSPSEQTIRINKGQN